MRIPHPIPYQGSKRNLAEAILNFFPADVSVLYEPFAGSAAVTLAAAFHLKAKRYYINDINRPLMDLWSSIVLKPEETYKKYANIWNGQGERTKEQYILIRENFNKSKKPECLLFLLARCVKASIRYNSNGEFNQSPDNRRLGKSPDKMKAEIYGASQLLKGKCGFSSNDYREVIGKANTSDLIYMDPPYQGTSGKRDSRYYQGVDFHEFTNQLLKLNKKNISFILSYDGRTGKKTYGEPLPASLDLQRIEINAGRSSQSTLLGRNHITYESLYISKALSKRLDFTPKNQKQRQLALF